MNLRTAALAILCIYGLGFVFCWFVNLILFICGVA